MLWVAIAIGISWGICGMLAYGLIFADLQRCAPEYAQKHRRGDWLLAAVFGLLGPIGLVLTACLGSTKHGLKFW